MAKHYLLDPIKEDLFRLWAIHSSLADYQVAFLLNKYSQTQLKKEKKTILWSADEVPFTYFMWAVPEEGIDVLLITNRCYIEEKNQTAELALFDLPQTKEVYLSHQLKHVDFFIMQYNPAPLLDFTMSLESVPGIEMVYEIEPAQQPTELNLIRN